MLSQNEITKLFDDYINDRGLFYDFKEWLEQQGYTLSELGMKAE